jgi:hypothetical protein
VRLPRRSSLFTCAVSSRERALRLHCTTADEDHRDEREDCVGRDGQPGQGDDPDRSPNGVCITTVPRGAVPSRRPRQTDGTEYCGQGLPCAEQPMRRGAL